MKNQYFGDNKDLFTCDLIYQIMQAGLVDFFTFIPMLTESDSTTHGAKTNRAQAKAGTENKTLTSFLDGCVKEGRRDIRQLENFFTRQAIKTRVVEKTFSHQRRGDYFKQIDDELLAKSLVFVSPDIGLEVARPGEKHLLFAEVKDLYQRMDVDSVLMLFQHFPRQPHLEYLVRRQTELKDKISGEEPICIDDNEIIFFFLTKAETLEHELTHLIEEYAGRYSG